MATRNYRKCCYAAVLLCLPLCSVHQAYAQGAGRTEWGGRSYANLMQISLVVGLSTGEPIEELLGCRENGDEEVRRVSAEKVFASALKKASLPEHLLVHSAYRRGVKPENPEAETDVGKWGSSYRSWWMSRDKWKLAKDFWWTHDRYALAFPILWDKKPELCGRTTNVLTIQGANAPVRVEDLDAYLRAASQWVQPTSQPVEEVLEMVRSDAPQTRLWAVRLLGARKDAERIPLIAKFLRDPRLEVRFAAAQALGMIGHPAAVPFLQAALREDPDSPRRDIARALGRIGGMAAVEPLRELLKDRYGDVRSEAAAAMAATGSQKAIPYLVEALGDEDKATRQAALESLIKLGWRPQKPESSPPQQ